MIRVMVGLWLGVGVGIGEGVVLRRVTMFPDVLFFRELGGPRSPVGRLPGSEVMIWQSVW